MNKIISKIGEYQDELIKRDNDNIISFPERIEIGNNIIISGMNLNDKWAVEAYIENINIYISISLFSLSDIVLDKIADILRKKI